MKLQLSLKKKWFEMTKSGVKTEDYREINYYWYRRLVSNHESLFGGLYGCYPKDLDLNKKNEVVYDIAKSQYADKMRFKNFSANIMTLGYPKIGDMERTLILAHRGIFIGEGNPEWGAEVGKLYFVIKHGVKL